MVKSDPYVKLLAIFAALIEKSCSFELATMVASVI
jgi:hypothetical protein